MKKLSSFWNRNDSYFRAGAGMCIYNDKNEFLIFERHLVPGAWQFPQGGRDKGEAFEDTLWRELHEETALGKEDFVSVTPYPQLLSYEYKNDIRKLDWVGQTHQWYFLHLKPGIDVELEHASHPEFNSFKWVSGEDALQTVHKTKLPVYKLLLDYFKKELQS